MVPCLSSFDFSFLVTIDSFTVFFYIFFLIAEVASYRVNVSLFLPFVSYVDDLAQGFSRRNADSKSLLSRIVDACIYSRSTEALLHVDCKSKTRVLVFPFYERIVG